MNNLIKIGDRHYKRCSVHLIDTIGVDGTEYLFKSYDNSMAILVHEHPEDYSVWRPQYVYVVGDSNLNNGEPFWYRNGDEWIYTEYKSDYNSYFPYGKRIIASTDPKIGKRSLSKEFISNIIASHHSKTCYDSVLVEHKDMSPDMAPIYLPVVVDECIVTIPIVKSISIEEAVSTLRDMTSQKFIEIKDEDALNNWIKLRF